MPHDEPHADDPLELVGVSLPADRESVREMAWAFAEEYARLGWGEERLFKLYRNPFYVGPHQAFLLLGEEEVRRIVQETLGAWGRASFVVRDPQKSGLPVVAEDAGPTEED